MFPTETYSIIKTGKLPKRERAYGACSWFGGILSGTMTGGSVLEILECLDTPYRANLSLCATSDGTFWFVNALSAVWLSVAHFNLIFLAYFKIAYTSEGC